MCALNPAVLFCSSRRFFELFEKYGGYKSGKLKLKKPKQLQVSEVDFNVSILLFPMLLLLCLFVSVLFADYC